MAVAVQTEPAFNAGKPEALFQGKYGGITTDDGQPWDISPDGKRFLMMKPVQAPAAEVQRKINIVVNWFEELKQRVPSK
jgi:ribosomal protein L21E